MAERSPAAVIGDVAQQVRQAGGQARESLRVKVVGVENLPAEGPLLLACNQPRGDSGRIVRAALARELTIGARDHLFAGSGRLDAIRRRMLVERHRRPLEPVADAPAAGSLIAELRAGGTVLLFPEEGPTPDGAVHRGHPDVAWLAVMTHAPVVPLALLSASGGQGNRVVDRVLGQTLRVGQPLDFSRFWTTPSFSGRLDAVILRGITDEIMDAIRVLGDLAYRDSYRDLAKLQVSTQKERERRNRVWPGDIEDELRRQWRAADQADERRSLAIAQQLAREQALRAAQQDEARQAVRRDGPDAVPWQQR